MRPNLIILIILISSFLISCSFSENSIEPNLFNSSLDQEPRLNQKSPTNPNLIHQKKLCDQEEFSFTYLNKEAITYQTISGNFGDSIADSTSIITKDNKIRSFFFSNSYQGIVSAISNDGINFEFEGEVGISGGQGGQPQIIESKNGYFMMFIMCRDGICLAEYGDGLNFILNSELLIDGEEAGLNLGPDSEKMGWLSVVKLGENNYRGYWSNIAKPGIVIDHKVRSYYSTDLINWILDEGVRVGEGAYYLTDSARQPFSLVVDNTVLLFYSKQPSVLYVAKSSDGLNGLKFEEECYLGIEEGAGTNILEFENKYLMYHDSMEESPHIRVGEIKINLLND